MLGACVFSCNLLPPALFAEWQVSFVCYSSNLVWSWCQNQSAQKCKKIKLLTWAIELLHSQFTCGEVTAVPVCFRYTEERSDGWLYRCWLTHDCCSLSSPAVRSLHYLCVSDIQKKGLMAGCTGVDRPMTAAVSVHLQWGHCATCVFQIYRRKVWWLAVQVLIDPWLLQSQFTCSEVTALPVCFRYTEERSDGCAGVDRPTTAAVSNHLQGCDGCHQGSHVELSQPPGHTKRSRRVCVLCVWFACLFASFI